MSDYIRQLHEKRMRAWEAAKETLETAASEKRDLTAEEDEKYLRANQDISDIDEKIAEYQESQRKAVEANEYFAKLEKQPTEGRQGVADPNEELRAFARGERGRVLEVRANEEQLTLGKANPSGTTGGDTVRTDFYSRLIQHLIVNSGVLQAGPTELNTAGGEALQIPKTTAHSLNASIVAENAQMSVNDPQFGMATLDAYKYAFLMKVTHELMNDTSVDLMGYMAMQAGRALGNGFGAHLVTGTGSSQPNGVATAATAGVTGAATVLVPTADDLIDLYYSIIAPYRNSPSCGWLLNDATVADIRKLKDANNVYVWQPGLLAGAPDMILGKPVHTDPNMATKAAGNGKKTILFGDFSTYFVRRVETVRFERSDDFAFDTDVVTFRAILRGDGDQIDTTGAIKAYVTGAAS